MGLGPGDECPAEIIGLVVGQKAEGQTARSDIGGLLGRQVERFRGTLFDDTLIGTSAVDEFEHILVFWQPGVTQYDRNRLTAAEWSDWGSRGVWNIRSVRRNNRHEAEFPEELARRVVRLLSPKGGLVIDPFVGTGTTACAAKELGRVWLGVDIDPLCTAIAMERVADG